MRRGCGQQIVQASHCVLHKFQLLRFQNFCDSNIYPVSLKPDYKHVCNEEYDLRWAWSVSLQKPKLLLLLPIFANSSQAFCTGGGWEEYNVLLCILSTFAWSSDKDGFRLSDQSVKWCTNTSCCGISAVGGEHFCRKRLLAATVWYNPNPWTVLQPFTM